MIEPSILYYCKYQERCHKEVRNKLYELGFRSSTVELQISELIAEGVLNEARFAASFARGKFRIKGWGRVKIRQQLKLRGISDYCIKKAFGQIDPDEYALCLEKYTVKKLAELRSERNVLVRKAKLYRYLLQKGYEADLINDAIKEHLPAK
jgi:regulatory protein